MKPSSCDVLVAGGGVAGVLAATAAARGGARTILVEKDHVLGGTGHAGMFQNICGLYLNGVDLPADTLNEGLVREVVSILHASDERNRITRMGQVYVLSISDEGLQKALLNLCENEQNLSVMCDTESVAVEAAGENISGIRIRGSGGEYVITTKMTIDCSGDGTVAAQAGASYEIAPPEELQLAGFTVRIKGLTNAGESLAIKVPFVLGRASSSGGLDPSLRFTTFSPGNVPDEGFCKLSIGGFSGPEREEKARSAARAVLRFLSNELPEFANASIVETSPRVLDREGRRVCGEYTLTENDVLTARKFPDGVVKNAWPIELWDPKRGTVYHYVPQGDYYEIPFRCLKVRGIANLLTAGRCISASHEALASTRVMGTCMALGEKAGSAAAYWIKNGEYPRDIKRFLMNDQRREASFQ